MLEKSRAILVGAVIVIVAVNLFQFRPIDIAADSGYSALSRPSSVNIMAEALETPFVARSYGMYLSLAATAPGAIVLVSETGANSTPAFRDHALGFGKVKEVRLAEFDEIANHVLSPEEFLATPDKYEVAATGTQQVDGQTIKKWQIVTGDCSPDQDSGLARQFAAMRMNENGANFLLLIESCLLPEGTVNEK